MSKKTIPATQIVTCDRCKKEVNGGFGDGMAIKGSSWSHDWQGNGAGSELSYDFCGKCSESFYEWMKAGKK